MKTVFLFALVILLVGCASTRPETEQTMNSWIGVHQSRLIQRAGPPTYRTDDGQGGYILVYQFDRDFGQTPGRFYTIGKQMYYTSPQQVSTTASYMFYVNSEGYIYYWAYKDIDIGEFWNNFFLVFGITALIVIIAGIASGWQ